MGGNNNFEQESKKYYNARKYESERRKRINIR